MINWKLRLKNKATMAAIIGCVVAFIYQMLGIFGITAPISEEQITQLIGLVINMLVMLGVLVDPTTSRICDSSRAMEYRKPK